MCLPVRPLVSRAVTTRSRNFHASFRTLLASIGVVVGLAFASTSLKAQTVVETVTTGTSPNAVAVNPVTNMVYTANYGSGNVTAISAATGSVTATVTAGSHPFGIAINPGTNTIYVAIKGPGQPTER